MIRNLIIFFFGATLLISCKKEEVINTEEKLPIDAKGFFIYNNSTVLHYEGDSIVYNDFDNTKDSIHFFYKDSIIGIDSFGTSISYQFERFISYDSISYTFLNDYTITINSAGIILTQNFENDYILPEKITKLSRWNGNQFKQAEEQIYLVKTLENLNYLSAMRDLVKVNKKEEINLIREDLEENEFVSELGLIFAYKKGVDKDIVTGNIKSGSIVTLVYKP